MLKRFLIAAFLTISLMANATKYYVSSTGNDLANGTTTLTPWQTLSKINSTSFNQGDSILFKRGDTFTGSFTVAQNGTSSAYIYFGAYGSGAKPIFNTYVTITNWTNLGNNLWESDEITTLNYLNTVTFNDVPVAMGRYPKATTTPTAGEYLTYYTHVGKTSITSKYVNTGTNWTGAEVVVRCDAYTFSKSTITNHVDSTLTVSLGGNPTNGSGFFIQNDIRCCTQQNDWYFNSSTHKLTVYSTTQPSNVKIPTIERIVTINGNYIKFENITFTGANGCAMYSPNTTYNHLTVDSCVFTNNGIASIYTLLNYLTVEDCDINNSVCGVSTLFGINPIIRRNTLTNIGILAGMRDLRTYAWSNSAIYMLQSANVLIEYNKIINTGYNGIYFYGSNSTVRYNYINNFCTLLNDGGAIYTYTGTSYPLLTNVKIHDNICVNAPYTGYGIAYPLSASGIYLDLNSAGIEIYNNSIANTQQYGIFITSEGHVSTHHNTIFNASQFQLYYIVYDASDVTTTDSMYYNICVAKEKVSTSDPTNYWGVQKAFGISAYTGSETIEAHTLAVASNYADYNCFARPVDDGQVVWTTRTSWGAGFYTLNQYKTYSGQNAHSYGSPQAVSSSSKLHFIYNETQNSKVFSLASTAKTMQNVDYTDSVVLAPWTSMVLISDTAPVDQGEIIIPEEPQEPINSNTLYIKYNGMFIKFNNKILKL